MGLVRLTGSRWMQVHELYFYFSMYGTSASAAGLEGWMGRTPKGMERTLTVCRRLGIPVVEHKPSGETGRVENLLKSRK